MLKSLLNPTAVAIIGASPEIGRPGGQPLHALTSYGFQGEVYAVNPRRSDINGHRCFPNVAALPGPCDVAIIAVPAAAVPDAILECGAAKIPYAIILSAGFREIGERGAALQGELDAAIAKSGVRVVGPNCTGVLALPHRLFAGFGAGFRNPDWKRGPVAMISQSGGFAYSIVSFCQEAGVGIDYVISTGNEASLGALDFIEHFLADDEVRLIGVYLEGLTDGRRLRALGRRALEAGKPIAVWKVGNTQVGQRAAVSHTANLTEDYDYYRDAFAEGGFIEVREVYDLIDAAKVFRAGKRPQGRRVAVLTTSGGAGVLLADRCAEAGLELPPLGEQTRAALNELLPDFGSIGNPIDLTAALAQNEPKFSAATELVVRDDNIDVAMIRSFPGRDTEAWAESLVTLAQSSSKPLLVSLSGTSRQAAAWSGPLEDAGIACFEVPSRAATAAAMLCEFSRRRSAQGASHSAVSRTKRVELPLQRNGASLTEHVAKDCLAAYGIRTPRRHFVPLGAPLPAFDLHFPVVAKIVSADILHKTEAGGVVTGVARDALPGVLKTLEANARQYKPGANLEGFLIEEQAQGVEMIVGALNNPAFGPLVLVGLGGVHAEVFRDVQRRYAPVDHPTARAMIDQLQAAPLLSGYRGAAPCDIDALCDVIVRLSRLAADHESTVAEVEVNPVLVGRAGDGACAVDAIVRCLPAS